VAAEKAQEKANALKKLCEETAAAALKTAKGELEALNKAVKKLPKTDSEGHATFHGDYRKSVDELEAALKFSDGPDEAKITKLVQLLPTQLAAIKPGGTLNEQDFLASHKKGLREEQAEGDAKENAKKKLAEIKKLYETTSKKLSNADPADVNELKSIKRSFDEVSDSFKGLPPEQALQRLGQIETRLRRLIAEPGGSAVRARGNLDKDAAALTNALKKLKDGLDTITQAIASGYDGENKDAAVKLVAQAKAALEAPDAKIQTSVRAFLANTGSEDLPARLKARELGASGVRDYRTLMAKNSVLAKLMADDPFTDGAMTSLRNALNGLELNILRGI
jgi:DNA repair exonuclease SbcCD ATPase subunit